MPHMLAFIIVLLVVGLIAGALARLLVPGRDPIGLLGTIVLGVLGSFLGGFILNLIEYHTLITHHLRTAGIIGSIEAPSRRHRYDGTSLHDFKA